MKALIINDLQNDFHPAGLAPVPGSDALPDRINALQKDFDLIIGVRFWMPVDHVVFAGNHLWRKPGQSIRFEKLDIELKEMFCVADSFGAEWMMGLDTSRMRHVLDKGTDPLVPPYSAFRDIRNRPLGLSDLLRASGVSEVVLAGVNFEDSLRHTLEDAKEEGFKAVLIPDAVAGLSESE